MLQSESGFEGEEELPVPLYAAIEQDDIFEESIDNFDDEMDNHYDDGIAHSEPDHLEDDSEEDFPGDDEDNITPSEYKDEYADYDELEE
ncbi:MAG: hypothetical protein PQJ58_05520 [Spirochaetales bacterium]|nr:hypothetical protein [Spirochaetales bacterium]